MYMKIILKKVGECIGESLTLEGKTLLPILAKEGLQIKQQVDSAT